MKRILDKMRSSTSLRQAQGRLLGLALVTLGLSSASLGLTYGQQLTQIGTFNPMPGESYPVYADVKILQATPDGNYMLYRGGNFQNYHTVQTFDGVPNLSSLAKIHTGENGLYPPNIAELPVIPGWQVCYSYDVKWNAVGSGLCKEGIDYGAYKNDPVLRLFKSLKAAEKEVVTKPVTGPTGPTSPPIYIPGSTGSPGGSSTTLGLTGVVGDFYPDVAMSLRDYNTLLAQIEGGYHEFLFYGQGINYPVPVERANTYEQISKRPDLFIMNFPTHSVTAGEVGVKQWHLPAYVEMELRDQAGTLIWRLVDTKGGFHPKDSGINNQRGNNHPWQATRYIKKGIYNVTVKNISKDSRAVIEFEWSRDGTVMQREAVQVGQSITRQIDVSSGMWGKLNCNFNNP